MRIDRLIKRYHEASGVSLRNALVDYNTLYDAMKPNNRYTVKVHGYLVHAYWRRKPMRLSKVRRNKPMEKFRRA